MVGNHSQGHRFIHSLSGALHRNFYGLHIEFHPTAVKPYLCFFGLIAVKFLDENHVLIRHGIGKRPGKIDIMSDHYAWKTGDAKASHLESTDWGGVEQDFHKKRG